MKKSKIFLVAFFLLLISFPLFLHLGSPTIRLWDESRLACNAMEMVDNGDYLVLHYDGKPDTWNSKPPFMIWMQVISMKLFGYNEVAIRLPSAIAALLTVFLMIIFCKKVLKDELLGYLAGLVLVTTDVYVHYHVSRTGDFDALLTLFTTFYSLGFYYLINKEKIKIWLLYLLCFAVILAALTKSTESLIMLPGLFIYTAWKKKLKMLFSSVHLYIGIVIFILIVGGYYLLREQHNPGYIAEVYKMEIGGHYLDEMGDHGRPFYFYFQKLFSWEFSFWIFLIPLSLIFARKQMKTSERVPAFIFYAFGIALTYIIIISFGQTKGWHYTAPAIPLFAVIAAYIIRILFKEISVKFDSGNLYIKYVVIIFTFTAIFFYPYQAIIERCYFLDAERDFPPHKFGYFMRQYKNYDNYTIATSDYEAPAYFYYMSYNKKGYHLKFSKTDSVHANETVLCCDEKTINILSRKYQLDTLLEWQKCYLFKTKLKDP